MCTICDNQKSSIMIDGVGFCGECLRFTEHLASQSGRDWHSEVAHQVAYIRQSIGAVSCRHCGREYADGEMNHAEIERGCVDDCPRYDVIPANLANGAVVYA